MASPANSVNKGQLSSKGAGKPSRSKAMSKRDFERMRDQNDRRSQQTGSWADQMEVDDKLSDAQKKQDGRNRSFLRRQAAKGTTASNATSSSSVKANIGNAPRMSWEPSNQSRLSTTETPPRDEPICEGVFKGSKLITGCSSHNLDFSGFPLLCREMYEVMAKEDRYISRNCPFAMYYHYCVTLLNVRILDYQKTYCKHDLLRDMPELGRVISIGDYMLPVIIKEYIQNIGNMLTPSGERVSWNLPDTAIPQTTLEYEEYSVPSGSFGPINAQNHNVYESYICPYISQGYIVATAANQGPNAEENWQPFPDGWIIPGTIATPNLLGYFPIETRLHSEAVQKLNRCEFTNDLTALGRIAYCPYAMTCVGDYIKNISTKIRVSKCIFTQRENSSIFVEKCYDSGELSSELPLYAEFANLYSPFSFGSDNGNKAQYFGLRRRRTADAPGSCLLIDGEVPMGWIDHINDNYSMFGSFQPRPRHDDVPGLRDPIHEETGAVGLLAPQLHEWLTMSSVK